MRAARLQRALDLLSGKDPDDSRPVAGPACRLDAEQGAALDAVMAMVRIPFYFVCFWGRRSYQDNALAEKLITQGACRV